jgi:hypothetical protein
MSVWVLHGLFFQVRGSLFGTVGSSKDVRFFRTAKQPLNGPDLQPLGTSRRRSELAAVPPVFGCENYTYFVTSIKQVESDNLYEWNAVTLSCN